jgi:hypothetical protein
MSVVYINGVPFSNYEYPDDASQYRRGFIPFNSFPNRMVGGTTGNLFQNYLTINSSREFNMPNLLDVQENPTKGLTGILTPLRIYIGGTQINLIDPNSVTRPILRYALLNTSPVDSGVSSTAFSSSTIQSLKRNANLGTTQRAVVLLQGAGGGGGSASSSAFAARDAAGGGSGSTIWILTSLLATSSGSNQSRIQVGGYGVGPSTDRTDGTQGGGSGVFLYVGSNPIRTYTAFAGGGFGGTSDIPNPTVGGAGGTASITLSSGDINTTIPVNFLHSEDGRSGGGNLRRDGFGKEVIAYDSIISPTSERILGAFVSNGSFSGANYIDFNTGALFGLPSTLTGSSAKAGGTGPSGGGYGGGASRYGRGGNGSLQGTAASNSSGCIGLNGSGGGGGDSNGTGGSTARAGSHGGNGFAILFF